MNHDPVKSPADQIATMISQILVGTCPLTIGDITTVAVAPTDVDQTNFKGVDGNRATTQQIAEALREGLGGSISTRVAYGTMIPSKEGDHIAGIRVDRRAWIQRISHEGRVTSSVEMASLEIDHSPRSEWSTFHRLMERTLISDTMISTLREIANSR
jgi:hypothetical protein